MIRTWRFATLFLAALGLAPGAAHALEMPVKMRYDPGLYAAVTSTLYRHFGSVGAVVQVGAVVAAAVLSCFVRRRPSSRLTVFGTLGLALSLALWSALVAPVNAEWGRTIASAPASIPEAYERLRPRWEYGHLAAFAAWLAGFVLLLLSALRETPQDADPPVRSGPAGHE